MVQAMERVKVQATGQWLDQDLDRVKVQDLVQGLDRVKVQDLDRVRGQDLDRVKVQEWGPHLDTDCPRGYRTERRTELETPLDSRWDQDLDRVKVQGWD
jgi:hypothetical protein